MILAIDIGNSNIVIGTLEKRKTLFAARLKTDISKTSDEYAIELKSVLELNKTVSDKFDGVIISSVVPELVRVFRKASLLVTGKQPLVIGPGVKTGLNIAIDNPAQLGSDLVAGAVAALNKYPAPIIIIDMGTATTVTVIDGNRSLIGGAIMPGVRLSLDALVRQTALLPDISLEAPKNAVGKNTVECMKSGIVLGAAAMIDGIIERIESELGVNARIVATGGIAGFITPNCKKDIILDKNLLLEGLEIIYEKNQNDR